MKVYIVMIKVDYEGEYIFNIYKSKEQALKAKEELKAEEKEAHIISRYIIQGG